MNETRPERTTTDEVTKLIERAGGASPRAGISIVHAARVHAVLQGNDFVTPNDVVGVINPILRHRLVFKPGEIEEGEEEIYLKEIIDTILKKFYKKPGAPVWTVETYFTAFVVDLSVLFREESC